MDFRGFDSRILRGGIPRPVGNLPECLSQAILVEIILVGKLSVFCPDSGRGACFFVADGGAGRRSPI